MRLGLSHSHLLRQELAKITAVLEGGFLDRRGASHFRCASASLHLWMRCLVLSKPPDPQFQGELWFTIPKIPSSPQQNFSRTHLSAVPKGTLQQ